jgi:hypothetical protein
MTDNPHHEVPVPGLTVQRRTLEFAMQSRQTGTLEIDTATNCLVVRSGATLIDVAWPLGWSVAIRAAEVALIDAAGQTAGLLGDEVAVGGGSVSVASTDVVTCTGRDQVFLASGAFERLPEPPP